MDTEWLLLAVTIGFAVLLFIGIVVLLITESRHGEEENAFQSELDSWQASLAKAQNRCRGRLFDLILPVHVYEKEGREEGECVICLSNLEEKDEFRVWPGCSHLFHRHCIDQWLCVNNTCPLCRAKLNLKYIEAMV